MISLQLFIILLAIAIIESRKSIHLPEICNIPKLSDSHVPIIDGLSKQIPKDIRLQNWKKSVTIMEGHLRNNTQEYYQLRKLKNKLDYLPKYAAYEGYVELIRLLLHNELPVNTEFPPYNRTMLLVAAKEGHFDLTCLLIKNGADIHMKSKGGNTTLHYYASSGSLDMVKLLVELGADINALNNAGDTPLHLVVRNTPIIEYLVENDADLTLENRKGKKAFDFCDEINDQEKKKKGCVSSAIETADTCAPKIAKFMKLLNII